MSVFPVLNVTNKYLISRKTILNFQKDKSSGIKFISEIFIH